MKNHDYILDRIMFLTHFMQMESNEELPKIIHSNKHLSKINLLRKKKYPNNFFLEFKIQSKIGTKKN